MKPLRLKMCQMPEAFNVFDAQLAQQRLQAGTTTLVSSKEVTTETPLFASWGIFTVVLSRVLILSGCDGDILQEGRQHDGEQPFGVAPHRDQRQGRSHHLPHQGRRRCRLPLSRRQRSTSISDVRTALAYTLGFRLHRSNLLIDDT
jgi:hypothetical protein